MEFDRYGGADGSRVAEVRGSICAEGSIVPGLMCSMEVSITYMYYTGLTFRLVIQSLS